MAFSHGCPSKLTSHPSAFQQLSVSLSIAKAYLRQVPPFLICFSAHASETISASLCLCGPLQPLLRPLPYDHVATTLSLLILVVLPSSSHNVPQSSVIHLLLSLHLHSLMKHPEHIHSLATPRCQRCLYVDPKWLLPGLLALQFNNLLKLLHCLDALYPKMNPSSETLPVPT